MRNRSILAATAVGVLIIAVVSCAGPSGGPAAAVRTPATTQSAEDDRYRAPIQAAEDLRRIGQALLLYQHQNGGAAQYPRTILTDPTSRPATRP